ncbi:alpha/beta fold hydrolase [Marivirga sp.]|uniref:alpha/beta fold hydrolase n=1 Tax=Marivirga sp. TaxID=2018662 RepID=UPI002D7EC043|nr:alpha/beta fold hydrolase [Marivirga sp.]HET8860496.1 alpha/beta fold hydrolase [Marivirga sp.]
MNKKNLILLHGALGSSKSFEKLTPYLSDQFNLIMPDLKWHGSRTEANGSFSMQDLVDDLENILCKEHIQSATVFGFSMGGYVALSLALKRADFFDNIMTLGTKLDWNPQQAAKETEMLNPDRIKEKVPQFEQHLKSLHGKNWSNLCVQTAEMMIDLGINPIISIDNISTIAQPIRFGLGDRDNMVSLNETVNFFRASVDGELQIFPNCQHPIEKVNPRLLASSITAFSNNSYHSQKLETFI